MDSTTEMAAVVGFIVMLVPVIVGILKAKTEVIDSSNAGVTSTIVGALLCVIANALGLFEPAMTWVQAIAFGVGGGLAGTGGYSVMSKVNAKPARAGRNP
jgi:hypothetical protein